MTTARELRLDYFRIYDIANVAAEAVVQTKGQFDRIASKGQLQALDLFGVCTMKNKEPLFDPGAHLTWYRLFQKTIETTRSVKIRNQFGDATLAIGKVEALLCPAQKLEHGSEPPRNLDHFKVYRVVEYGKVPEEKVALKDQFFSQNTVVLVPDFFAVPVVKTVGRKQFPIANPRSHLAIYRTPFKAFKTETKARDQFGTWPVQLLRAVALAVPTLKLSWK
ncbi:MAG TPA: hypothetical protein VI356_10010 [Myxococcales bacterium]